MIRRWITGLRAVSWPATSSTSPNSDRALSSTISPDSNQRSRWPSSRMTVSAPRHSERPTIPSQSASAIRRSLAFSAGRPTRSSTSNARPIGRLMKKM